MTGLTDWQNRVRWSLPFVVLLVFAATLPLGDSLSFGVVNLVHVTLMIVVLVGATARISAGLVPLRWHPSAPWLMLFGVVHLVSLMTARDPAVALRSVVTGGMGIALAFTVHALCTTVDRRNALMTVLVGMGIVAGLYGVTTMGSLETQFAGAGALSGRAEGVFNQPNQLGSFSAIMLMLGWSHLLGAKTRVEKGIAAACTVLSVVNLVVSFSRGAWLGALLGAVLLTIVSLRFYRRWFLRSMAAVLAIGIPTVLIIVPQVIVLMGERLATIAEPSSNPDDKRPFIYDEALRQILQRPILGQGPGNFEPTSIMAERSGASLDIMHSHSLFLQIAVGGGLIAVAAFLLLAASLTRQFWIVWRQASEDEAVPALGLVCALLTVIGQGMGDFTLGNPILFYLVWTIVGALLAATDRRHGSLRNATGEGLSR